MCDNTSFPILQVNIDYIPANINLHTKIDFFHEHFRNSQIRKNYLVNLSKTGISQYLFMSSVKRSYHATNKQVHLPISLLLHSSNPANLKSKCDEQNIGPKPVHHKSLICSSTPLNRESAITEMNHTRRNTRPEPYT